MLVADPTPRPRNKPLRSSKTAVKLKTRITLSNKESVAFKAPSGRPNGKEYLEGNGTEKNENLCCGLNPKSLWMKS